MMMPGVLSLNAAMNTVRLLTVDCRKPLTVARDVSVAISNDQ